MRHPELTAERDAPPLPLIGRRVLVTRAEDQAADFMARLRTLGAEPLACPTIGIVAPDDYTAFDVALQDLAAFDWLVFTSVNGVRAFAERATFLGVSLSLLARIRIAAVGPATAAALTDYGLAVGFVPQRHIAEGLVEELVDVAGKNMLLPTADIARPTLADGLRLRGATVTIITAYRTVAVAPADFSAWLQHAPSFDVATFTSSSTVHNFFALAGMERASAVLNAAVIACIGPKTEQTAREYGLRVDVVAGEHTTDGLLRSLVAYFASPKELV